jgi:peptidoglycan/LPS O-acetylase OafA/YrhL
LSENSIKKRIDFLDGLRGVAILLVILFHAYSRWTDIVPYKDRFAGFPMFAYGWLGVDLFFIISGFVILMTLSKCQNFSDFILRRWIRLFPAMFICSVLIWVTAPLFPERPAGKVLFINLIPGLTFVEPSLWSKFLSINLHSPEDSFWSLYVEVKFYILFGILFFTVGWRKALLSLVSFLGLYIIVGLCEKFNSRIDLNLIRTMLGIIGAKYYGWFASGAFYYKYFSEKRKVYFGAATALAIVSSLIQGGTLIWPKVFASLIATLFALTMTNIEMQKYLAFPGLLFLGYISYPLYLIHENMLIASIIQIGSRIPTFFAFYLPLLPIVLIFCLSWWIVSFPELWMRQKISRLLLKN